MVEIPTSNSNVGNGLSVNSTATVVDLDESQMSGARRQISPTAEVNQRASTFRWVKHPRIGVLESRSRVEPLSAVRDGSTAETYPIDWNGDRYDVTDIPTVGLRFINRCHYLIFNPSPLSNNIIYKPNHVHTFTINYLDIVGGKLLFKLLVKFVNSRHGRPNTKSDAGPHGSYDMTNSLDHNDEIKNADSNLINEIEFGPHYSFDNGDHYEPIESRRYTHYRPPRRPPRRPPAIYPIPSPQKKTSVSKNENLNWHTIGLLTFLKAGLIKLKLFGILKTLFVLLFKFKLFVIAMFIKFHLTLKLLKAFKHILPSLLILPLFPILTTLIFPTNFSSINLLPGQALNMFFPTSTAPSSVSNLLSNLIPNLPSLPGRPGLAKSLTAIHF